MLGWKKTGATHCYLYKVYIFSIATVFVCFSGRKEVACENLWHVLWGEGQADVSYWQQADFWRESWEHSQSLTPLTPMPCFMVANIDKCHTCIHTYFLLIVIWLHHTVAADLLSTHPWCEAPVPPHPKNTLLDWELWMGRTSENSELNVMFEKPVRDVSSFVACCWK